MTIRRGEAWGESQPLAEEIPWSADDAGVAAAVEAGASTVGLLLGGDLARTVGAQRTEPAPLGTECPHLPVDVGVVEAGGQRRLFVAHLIVRAALWAKAHAVMNSAFVGDWNVAPRAHPNDGRLVQLSSSLSLSDRFKARTRLPSGTHLPHPELEVRRPTAGQISLARGHRVFLDGQRWAVQGSLSWNVQPDAITIVI